jgi:outer membrane lipoprotein carrier protein
MPARQSADWRTPFALLAGEMKLSRLCAHWKVETQEHSILPDGVVISCKLHDAAQDKSDQGQHSLFLEIARSGELARVTVRDPGGIAIEFQFTNWRMDEPAAEALFRFSPPIGVTIVDGFNAPDRP